MASTSTVYSTDRKFRVDLTAFHTNLFVYKAAGATIRCFHWEVGRTLWWQSERWVERPVDYLGVRVSYEGMFTGMQVGSAVRGNSVQNASSCDERVWSFGVSLTLDEGSSTPTPGGAAILDVRGVRALGTAIIGTDRLSLGEVSAGRVTGQGPF